MPSDDPAAAPLPIGLRRPISRLRRTTVPIGTLAARVGGFGRYLGVGLRTRPATTGTAGSLSSVRVPDGAWSLWRGDDEAVAAIVAPDPAMAAIAARYQQRARRASAAPPVPRGIPSVLRRKAQSRSGPATGPSALAGRLRPTDTPVPRNEGHGAGVAAAAERAAAPGRTARSTGAGPFERATTARRSVPRPGAPTRDAGAPGRAPAPPSAAAMPAGPAPTGAGAAAAAAFAARFAAAVAGDAAVEPSPPGRPTRTPAVDDRPPSRSRDAETRPPRFGAGAPWSALASLARPADGDGSPVPPRARRSASPADRRAPGASAVAASPAGNDRSAPRPATPARVARPAGAAAPTPTRPAGPSSATNPDVRPSPPRPPRGSGGTAPVASASRRSRVGPRPDAVDPAGRTGEPVGARPLPMALVALTPAAASPLDRLPVDAAWLPRGVGLLERPDEAGHGTAVAAAHGTPRHDVARPEPTVARAARHRAGPTGRPVAARPLRHTADGVARRTGPVRGIDRVPVLGVVRPLGSRPLTAPERRDTTGPATEADLSTATGANAGAAAAWAARLADAWGSPSTAAAPAVAASPGTVAPSVMGRPSGSSAAPSAASVASAASSAVRRAENGPPPALAVRRVPAVVARLAALLPRAAAVAGVVVAPSPLAPAPARLTPIGAPTWTPAARAGAPSPTATSDRGAVGRARRTARRTSGSLEVGVVASVQRGPTRPAPVAPASTRAAIGGRPRPLHRSLSRPESGEPTSPSAPLAGKPTRGRPPSGPGTAEGSHPSAAERRPSVPSAPGAPAGPFAVTSSGVVSPAPRRGPFAVSPSGVVTAALPVRPAGPAPSDSSGGRTPDVPTSSSIRRSPVAATDVARGRTTDTARRSSPAVPHGASPSPVARVTSRPAHRRHALAAHLAQAGTRRGRALPTSFRPLARLLGDATVEVRHDAGAREALRRAGRPAATIGSTILLDRAPSDAPAMVERLAHELVHASERRPSPPRFFDDPQRDHEERRAHTIGRLARSLGPEAVPAALGAAGALPVRLSAIDGPAANATNATNASNATNATNVAGALGGVTSDVVPTPVFARSAVRRSASASAASRSTVRRSAASIGGAADGPEPGGPSPAPVERRSSTTTVARRSPAGTATAAPRTERTTSTQAPRESATARLDRVDELVAMVEARVIAELERRGGRHRGWL